MKKILIICGPTATGKTALAVRLAKKFSGELVSADSRQVYQGMDVVTGKDLPAVRRAGIKIYGYDLVRPDEEFSVAHFVNYAPTLINQISKKKKLPIIVGGSGLYLQSLVNPPKTLSIKPNWQIRKKLEQKSLEELQDQLKQLNASRWRQMNHSDKLNPRRLIRALEISLQGQPGQLSSKTTLYENVLWLGLTAPKSILDQNIKQRVKARLKAGALQEWQRLRDQYPAELASMSSIGYRQLPDIDKWIKAEQQYARRQLTWFRKNKKINWFDVSQKGFWKSVAKLVNSWYTSSSYATGKN